MRHFTTVLATFLFIACSTPDKENKVVTKDTILTTGQKFDTFFEINNDRLPTSEFET